MTRVYLADGKPEERSALRLLLFDLMMEVVGEASDWPTTLAKAPATHLDMLLIDWALLPNNFGTQALAELRRLCPNTIVIVLLSHLDAHDQAAFSVGANVFISKTEMLEQAAERLSLATASVQGRYIK